MKRPPAEWGRLLRAAGRRVFEQAQLCALMASDTCGWGTDSEYRAEKEKLSAFREAERALHYRALTELGFNDVAERCYAPAPS